MKRQHGYNLIELLIAIAMLGVVMLTILSLFVWGRKNVYSGKQMTTAIAIGTRAMEDVAPLTKYDLYNRVFDIADSSAGQNITFGGKTYANSAIRSTNASAVTGYADIQKQLSTGPKLLDKWKDQLQDIVTGGSKKERLLNGAVTVVMTPQFDSTNTPAQFGNSTIMRVRVIVTWDESNRRREVILDSVKPN